MCILPIIYISTIFNLLLNIFLLKIIINNDFSSILLNTISFFSILFNSFGILIIIFSIYDPLVEKYRINKIFKILNKNIPLNKKNELLNSFLKKHEIDCKEFVLIKYNNLFTISYKNNIKNNLEYNKIFENDILKIIDLNTFYDVNISLENKLLQSIKIILIDKLGFNIVNYLDEITLETNLYEFLEKIQLHYFINIIFRSILFNIFDKNIKKTIRKNLKEKEFKIKDLINYLVLNDEKIENFSKSKK